MGPGCTNCPVLKTAVFQGLSRDELEHAACVFHPARYRRNQILYFEGGAAQHLFALHTGLVKLVKSLENGKDRITGVLFPGEIFGLESLTDASYPLSAVALNDCEICSSPREDFTGFLQAHSQAALGLVKFLVNEIGRVRTQVTDMSFKDARKKVATFLLSLLSSQDHADNGVLSYSLPVSRQEMSEILELAPETVSRTLTAFRREQLVTARGRHVVIKERQGLEKVARR